MDENAYIKSRLDDQINWYGQKSAINKRYFRFCQVSQLVLATLVTLSGTVDLSAIHFGNVVIPVLGAIIAIISGLLGLYKYQELWIEYRTVTESLKHEKFRFLTKSEPYQQEDAFSLLVNNVESLISKENTKWSQSIKNREGGRNG